MFKNNFTKSQQWILVTSFVIFIIICALFVYIMIDFYNDYKCSTTTDIRWFLDNNCMRYYD